MKRKAAKIFSAALLLVFVNFMFSNTVFTHYHLLSGGRLVAHSHPYTSSSHHTHTANELDLIASLNLTASSADTPCADPSDAAPIQYALIVGHYDATTPYAGHLSAKLREPPCC
ncbi:hypothetical protein EEL50_01620 [Muribaculaceae bacterium Isolate-105 (HZI)]|nr:hypothetical protein EEL50_01620 [Muribaculaceae bacterium Isolate-105 (HZI)]